MFRHSFYKETRNLRKQLANVKDNTSKNKNPEFINCKNRKYTGIK